MGVEESRKGSTTFIEELVPTKATVGAYHSRSLRNTRLKDLIVVPSLCAIPNYISEQIPTTAAMAKGDNGYSEPPRKNQPTDNDFYEMLCRSISRIIYTGNDFHAPPWATIFTSLRGQRFHEPPWATISRASMGNHFTSLRGQPFHEPPWATISRASVGNNFTRCYVGASAK